MPHDESGRRLSTAELRTANELQKLVWSMTTTFRVGRVEAQTEVEYRTGSGVLLDLNGTLCVLTAWHVYGQLLEWEKGGHEAYAFAHNAALDPATVLFEDRENDIVVLSVPRNALPRIDARPHVPAKWPPRRVTTDDIVVVCGYPAYLRSESASREILFGDFNAAQPVVSVSEHQFALILDREEWISVGRVPMPGSDVFLGGLSGGAVVALDGLTYPLVGIVSEIGQQSPILFAKSLAHLPSHF
jgi:hypothetical protein